MRTTIPATIVLAEPQRAAVERLVKYCEDLDGTKVVVLEGAEGTRLPYPLCNDAAFHQAAEYFKGKAFFWMEPDSIPRTAGWLQKCTDEFRKSGKEFMLSSDSHPPHDKVGGIGIYGPNSHWFIPKRFENHAWDMWLLDHAPDLVHWSPLIQHSYGLYRHGAAQGHRFPKNNALLREDSVIFHRDKFQDLIDSSEEITDPARIPLVFRHGGDLGDIIAALPILRQLGGGQIVLFHDPEAPVGMRGRESLEGARFEAIKPLLAAQEYVYGVDWGVGVDTKNFRLTPRPMNESLLERQARHAGVWPLDQSPWLTVPESTPHKRIVCARSARYHNPIPFPWKELSQTYGDRLLFVGLPAEHAAFEQVVGCRVEHAKTENFLDIATLMAGAPQVVCNQSAPLWVAIGLGCKIICEANAEVPNSQIHRSGSFWAYTAAHMDTLRRSFANVRSQKP